MFLVSFIFPTIFLLCSMKLIIGLACSGSTRSRDVTLMVTHSFSRSENQKEYENFRESQEIIGHSLSPFIVGVAGGSGSGKTTLVNEIVSTLGNEHITYISHDSYYKDLCHLTFEEKSKTNFDHPDSLDTHLLINHLESLKIWNPINVPKYDFTTHSRTAEIVKTYPKKIIIVDGILIFSQPKLLDLFDMKIFVDTDDDIRLIRRIKRDTIERKRTVESILAQYEKSVRPMFQLFVEPSKKNADIIVPAGSGIQKVALNMCVSHLREIIQTSNNIFQ